MLVLSRKINEDIIITREEIIHNSPELVKKFLKAVIEAHNWSKKNKTKAVKALIKYDNSLKFKDQIEVFSETIKYIYPKDDTLPMGKMSMKRWEDSQQLLIKSKVLKKEINLKEAFTNIYLPYD